jgi:hypothetical protein
MKLQIIINSNDAACNEDPIGEVDVALRRVLYRIAKGELDGSIVDTNGNRIGDWDLDLYEHEEETEGDWG